MASESSSSFEQFKIPLIALAILSPVIIFVITILIFMGGNDGKRNGAQPPEYISLSDGKSTELITELTRNAKSPEYLVDNAYVLDSLSATSQKLRQLYTTDSYFSAHPKKSEAIALLDTIDQNIAAVKSKATTDKKGAQTAAKLLLTHINQLGQLLVGSANSSQLASIATAAVQYNGDGASGKIPYLQRHDNIVYTSEGYPSHTDCSAFVDFVLSKAGAFPKTYWPGTSELYSLAKNNKYNLTIVKDNSSGISKKEVEDMVKSGALQPGDILLSGTNYPGNQISVGLPNHAVMYIGGDASKNVAQSTTKKGRSGPQFVSLEERLNKNNLRAIIRVKAQG